MIKKKYIVILLVAAVLGCIAGVIAARLLMSLF